MNVMVLYDSKFGNTEHVARALGGVLERGTTVAVHAIGEEHLDVEGVDLLVLGGPTHAHGLSAPMRAFLESLQVQHVAAAAFDTRFHMPRIFSGSAATKIARSLEHKGARLVVPPQSFFVQGQEGPLLEGELDRINAWAAELLATIGAPAEAAALS